MSTRPRSWIASTTAALTLGSALASTAGCAGLFPGSGGAGTGVGVDLSQPEFQDFDVAKASTQLERDVRVETGGDNKYDKLPTGIFWAGIGVGTFMAAGAIGFGVAGYVVRNDLSDYYNQGGGITQAEGDDLRDRGNLYNDVAIAGATLAVISYAAALIAYGIDWNRCGPLVEKKRRCKELGLD